jgi:photosystem II stability/assembly factor-like uncharacterized protein
LIWAALNNPQPGKHLYATASYSPNFAGTAPTSYVAVGQGGVILRSDDSNTWASQNSPTTNDLYAITSTGTGIYVAVGANGTIIYSQSNGITWSPASVPTAVAGKNLYGVTYSNLGTSSVYVAVGSAGTLLTSYDGITWSSAISGTVADLKGIAFGSTTLIYGLSPVVVNPLYTNGVNTFVAVGNGGALVVSRDNGLSWMASATAIPVVGNLNAVTYARQFITVGDGGGVFTSPDGLSWTSQASGTTAPLYSIAHGRFDFSVVGGAGSPVGTVVGAPAVGLGVTLHAM